MIFDLEKNIYFEQKLFLKKVIYINNYTSFMNIKKLF